MSSDKTEIIKLRAAVLEGIRDFFSGRGFTEADVPLLAAAVIPEAPIELFRTELVSPYNPSTELFMLPSPEYYLKQLIAEGAGDIYSISRSFRNSEQTGRQHNPEFTMLEYYAMNFDYIDSIKLTEDLFSHIIQTPLPKRFYSEAGFNPKSLEPPFERLSMDQAFEYYAGFDLKDHCTGKLSPEEECTELRTLASELGLHVSEDDSWEELFNLVFVHEVEPKLPLDRPVLIYDYPSGIPALAKPAAANGRLERWELYAGGVELANCYSEETDYITVSNFFEKEAENKKNAMVGVKPDKAWCEMYRKSFPKCSGTALGVDRLMMMLSGSKSIEGVILFPFSDILPKKHS